MIPLLALRALALTRHRAATSKVSRLKSKGINIAGSDYDVRRPAANIKKYNRKQLESYINKVDKFTSRSNQFVAGAEGTPLPMAEWQKHERLRNAVNYRNAKRYGGVKNIFVNPAGRTVEEVDADTAPSRRRAKGALSHRTYSHIDREASDIRSVDALKKLNADLRKKLRPGYAGKRLKGNRLAVNKMLEEIGQGNLIKRMNALSDDQFTVLWEYSSSPEEIVPLYQIAKARGSGQKLDRARAAQEPTHFHELEEHLDWAEQLPESIDRYNT